MPAGHNGPWQQRETPLRNTGNWLQVLLWSSHRAGGHSIRQAAERAAGYLLEEDHRPGGGAFLHLPECPGREGNGLIGQAWTIHALFVAFQALGWDELRAAAQAVVRAHAFDDRLGLWMSLGLDGRPAGLELTLNQQVWFAAAALQDPAPEAETTCRVRRFLHRLPTHIRLTRAGRIEHRIHPMSLWKRFPAGWRSTLRGWRTPRAVERERSIGYHSFVLHGLGMLLPHIKGRAEIGDRSVKSALAYADSDLYRTSLESNPFAYGYNPTGFEMAFASLRFVPHSESQAAAWAGAQVGRALDPVTGLMTLGSTDPMTLAGRICEAVLLPDWPFETS